MNPSNKVERGNRKEGQANETTTRQLVKKILLENNFYKPSFISTYLNLWLGDNNSTVIQKRRVNMDNVKLEPLRTLNDFVLTEARFQVPDVSDPERWNKRVTANLIYYQTNYFLMMIIIFLIVGVLHPQQMLIGTGVIVGVYFAIDYALKNQNVVTDFKKNYPRAALMLVFVLGYFVISLVSSVLVFCFGILLPIAVVFIHSSLRLRDAKNKLSNLKEKLHIKQTPMGLLLEELGMTVEGLLQD